MAFGNIFNYVNQDGTPKEGVNLMQPYDGTASSGIASPQVLEWFRTHPGQDRFVNGVDQIPGSTWQQPTSSGDYTGTNADLEALLGKYQAGINVQDPNSIRLLVEAMNKDGIPAELSSDGLLLRVPGYDAGWVDPRQDQAYVQGRGGIRGWAFQPYYGSEDFDRLVAEGRNP